MNYYNDNDPFAAAWLDELIKAGELGDGSVDARSIIEVVPSDLGSFRQCHFFAGIGGWARALKLAQWPEGEEIWTASLPCQPLSVAGARQGALDGRHLWPAFYRLVAVCRPPVIVGEQVAGADGREWFAGVRADLEDAGYACGAAIMPACSVGAPHRRERLYWCAVADADSSERGKDSERWGDVDDGTDAGWPEADGRCGVGGASGFWDDAELRVGADGKSRRVVADLRSLVDGLSESLGRLCLDYFKEAAIPIMGYAETTKSRPDQVLRAVWDQIASEKIWQESRGFFGIQEKEILWFFLLEFARRFDGIWVSGAIEEASREGMRSLWLYGRSSCPSQGWGRDEQRSVKHTDALRLLSQLLACHARQAFEAVCRANAATLPLLVTNAPNRVGRLRGYGNAIVPQVAAKFIKAMMEVMGEE